ncbi:MAG: hypothetical protein ACRD8Z_10230, partial [Nitrososphaeraceae archaeon]
IEDIISHYYMALLQLEQLSGSLWRIVINSKTKDYDRLRALKQIEECSSHRLLLLDRAVHDAVLPYIHEKLEYLNKKELNLKTQEKELKNYLKQRGLTTQDDDSSGEFTIQKK